MSHTLRYVRLSKKSRPADMCGWTGHIQGNLALRVCEPLCGECAVQHQILSPGGYQGEGISAPRLRAEMGSPWSVSFFDTLLTLGLSPGGAGRTGWGWGCTPGHRGYPAPPGGAAPGRAPGQGQPAFSTGAAGAGASSLRSGGGDGA